MDMSTSPALLPGRSRRTADFSSRIGSLLQSDRRHASSLVVVIWRFRMRTLLYFVGLIEPKVHWVERGYPPYRIVISHPSRRVILSSEHDNSTKVRSKFDRSFRSSCMKPTRNANLSLLIWASRSERTPGMAKLPAAQAENDIWPDCAVQH